MSRTRPRAAVDVVVAVIAVSREREVSVKAAGLAYHAVNTLVPLAILLLVGVTVVDALEPALVFLERESGLDAATTGESLEEVAGNGVQGQVRATVIAFVILCWSGVRLFRAIKATFTSVYGSRQRGTAIGTVLDVALSSLTVLVGVGLVGAIGGGLAFVADGIGWRLLRPILLFAALVTAFLPMYYVYPQTDVTVGEVLPGTVFAAAAWTALVLGFRLYVATAESVELFGLAGALLLVLTWVYLGGLALLVGAVGNAVLAERVEPDDDWVPLGEAIR